MAFLATYYLSNCLSVLFPWYFRFTCSLLTRLKGSLRVCLTLSMNIECKSTGKSLEGRRQESMVKSKVSFYLAVIQRRYLFSSFDSSVDRWIVFSDEEERNRLVWIVDVTRFSSFGSSAISRIWNDRSSLVLVIVVGRREHLKKMSPCLTHTIKSEQISNEIANHLEREEQLAKRSITYRGFVYLLGGIPSLVSPIGVHDISQWYYHSIFLPYQTINEDTLLDIYYR